MLDAIRRALGTESSKTAPALGVGDLIAPAEAHWRRAGRYELAHWRAADKFAERHRNWSVLSSLLTALTATTLFATLAESEVVWLKIAAGGVSVITVLCAALVTHRADDVRAGKHSTAAARFAALRGNLEMLLIELRGPGNADRAKSVERLAALRLERSQAVKEAPVLSRREYGIGREEFDATYPEKSGIW